VIQSLSSGESEINVTEDEKSVITSVGDIEIAFSKDDGTILSVNNYKGNLSFSGGHVPAGIESDVTGVHWKL
jgi:hypothetical protein